MKRSLTEAAEHRQGAGVRNPSDLQPRTRIKNTGETNGPSEGRYRAVFEASATPMVTVGEDTTILMANSAALKISGYSGKEMVGRMKLAHLIHPDDVDRGLRYYRARPAARTGGPNQQELRLVDKGGNVRFAVLSAATIPDSGQKIISVVDVTGQRLVQDALAEAKEHAENIIRTANVMVIGLDLAGNIRTFNQRAEALTGFRVEEVMGRHWSALCGPGSPGPEVGTPAVECAVNGGLPATMEKPIVTKSGEHRHIYWRNSPVREEGRVTGTVLFGLDITEHKNLEQQMAVYRQLDKMKTDLLSTVSHELRTPLATIKGYSTMLLDYDEFLRQDEKREYLESIDKATDRLTELVDHLLDMSRLEAGLLKLERMPTNILQLVATSVAEAQLRAPGHRIVLKHGARLPRVNADARRIRQVIDNILDNAVKYSAEGTTVTVELRRKDNALAISVADQGIGISKEDLPHIFNRMQRAKQRLSPHVSGLGLGLGLCKGLVEAHGGRIWMESDFGKGSTCHFTLPVARERRGAPA